MRNKIILVLLFITIGVSLSILFPRYRENLIREEAIQVSLVSELKNFPGKEIFETLPQWLVKKNKPFYAAVDFQKIIKEPLVVLDKDVYLDLGVFIDNPVKISSDLDNRKKIYLYNNSVAFSIFSDDVSFENIDFYLINIPFFLQAREDKLQRLPRRIKFKNCKFFIWGSSSVTMSANQLTIEDSFFYNQRKTFLIDSFLLLVQGIDIVVKNNSIVDLFGGVNYPLYVEQSQNIDILNNILIAYQNEVKGIITINNSKKINILNNFIEDINFNLKSLALVQAPLDEEETTEGDFDFMEGGVGVWTSGSENVDYSSNIWGVNNRSFDQEQNRADLALDVVHSQISQDLGINCKNNEKIKNFLKDNPYLKCQN